MIKTDVDSLWLLAMLSKIESLSLPNTLILTSLLLLSFLILHLTFWVHPGGPAWGHHRWAAVKSKTSPPGYPPIPGPRGLPFIGSMCLMSGLAHHHTESAAQAHRARRLMSFSLGQTRAVVTCDPNVAKEILNSPAFSDRPAKESAYRLMFNRSIGFAPYGAYWAALRRISAAHLFCPRQIQASGPQRTAIAEQIVGVLAGSGDPAAGIRVRDVLKHASLNNMMWSVFGRRYEVGSGNPEMEELRDLVEQGYDLLGKLNWSDHIPCLADLDLQWIRFRCGRVVPRVNRFVGRIIAEHKAGRGCGGGGFVDVLLSLKGADRLSDQDMIAVLWEMIFRGTDTVAVLMEWILARLVLHPDVQSKVHAELDKVVGESHAISESDLPQLTYLTAVVKEVLRMHPPGPLLSWSRLSIRDSVIDGHLIPAGTTAMVNMWAIMRDPKVWADPLTFNPCRFMGRGEVPVLGSDLRIAPFGSGRRSCPGKILGLTTVISWVATMLHKFRFDGIGQNVDLTEVLRLSCEMANPLMIKVRPRRGLEC